MDNIYTCFYEENKDLPCNTNVYGQYPLKKYKKKVYGQYVDLHYISKVLFIFFTKFTLASYW